jgi:hypothetical protein
MATELEQFVEANKTRLAEVNASNPPLYSAISLALDYLNKNYFGGTSEIKVELPSVAPQITETPSIQVAFELRLFTEQEIKDLIQKNGWDNDTFKMTKIKVANDIESENFQRLAFQLGAYWVGSEKYDIKKKKKVYFVEDNGELAFNTNVDTFEAYPEYTTIEYDVIFADLLPQAKTTQTNDRIFTDSELEKLIFDNVWTGLDFKEIKIELKTNIEKTNFVNFIKKLVGGQATYIDISDGNYFYSDEDVVIYNGKFENNFNLNPYQQLFYNQIFEDLLKTQGKTTEVLPTFWDKAICTSSSKIHRGVDYDFLIKSLSSKRRSKDMKFEIARAFGDVCFVMKNTKSYSEAIDFYEKNNLTAPTTEYIYRYTFDPKVAEIFDKKGFDAFDISQYSDLNDKEWVNELVFPMFEQQLKIDPIVDELIEYYNEKIGQPSTQQTTLTRGTPLTQPSTSNFQFNVGEQVKILDKDGYFRLASEAFKELKFENTTENRFKGNEGDIGLIEATYQFIDDNKVTGTAYKITMITGKDFGKEFLFDEKYLELVQAQPQQPSNFAFNIGDKVSINELSFMLYSFKGLMKKIGLDESKIDSTYKPSLGEMGVIVVRNNDQGFEEDIYGVELTNGKQILVKENGLYLEDSVIEVGDWVEIIDVNLLVGVPINSVGVVEKFDNIGDPYIKWIDLVGEDGYFKLDRFKVVKKQSDVLFEVGDIIKLKEDVTFSSVKKGAVAVVTGIGISNGRIQVKFDWGDTDSNKKFVGRNKMSDEWWEGYFELAMSNKLQEKIVQDVIDSAKTQATSPVGLIKPDDTIQKTEENEDEDFEDLANQLEDLDF